jgi:tetratricopeptide (TPR) repeat protein
VSKKKIKGLSGKEAIRLFNLAQGKIKSGDFPAAESLLRKAAAADPDLFLVHAALGGVFEKRGKKKEAVGAYRRTLTLQPGHVKSHIALGRIAFEKMNMSARFSGSRKRSNSIRGRSWPTTGWG